MKYLYNDIEITEVEFYEKVYNGELDNLSNAMMGTGKRLCYFLEKSLGMV